VLFELGFAGNKPILPIIHRAEDRNHLPAWLTIDQLATYEGTGLAKIGETIVTKLLDSGQRSARRRPGATPGHVVWLQGRDSDWANSSRDRFSALAREHGIEVHFVVPDDLFSFEDLRNHLRAWLVVGCIDGGTHDYAAHFFFGDVVGRLRAGSGNGAGQSLNRAAMVFARDETILETRVADSVKRVERDQIILATSESDLLAKGSHQLQRLQRWLNRPSDEPAAPRRDG
jgi:hypothetical protein